jgi:cytochrome oxidase assembly protein ShyY1
VLAALIDGTGASDGVTVIVNRGFIPLGVEPPRAPADVVEVLGRIRVPPERRRGQLTDSTNGPVTEVRRVELERLDEQFPGEVAPIYLDLIGSVPNVTATDPVPVPAPALDEGPHLSYAVQWFIFAGAVFVGWVLAVRRSIRTHTAGIRRDLTDAATGPTPPDSPRRDVAASTTTTSRTDGS